MDKPSTHTDNFVRNDRCTRAAAAERINLPGSYSPRQRDDEFGVVIRSESSASLQYSLLFVGTQLQSGFAHLTFAFVKAPLVEREQMQCRQPADLPSRTDLYPAPEHFRPTRYGEHRIRKSNDLFLFAHSAQIHSGEITSRVTFVSIPSISRRYTFASIGSATASAGKNSGTSRRATPIRLSAIP
jgi:hypothetical protein